MSNAARARLTKWQRRGRSGKKWAEARRLMFATQGDVCWICGHRGASDADHMVPVSQGGDPLAQHNLRPAHGWAPCATCGKRCNWARGDGRTAGGRARKQVDSHKRLNTSEVW